MTLPDVVAGELRKNGLGMGLLRAWDCKIAFALVFSNYEPHRTGRRESETPE